MPSTLSSQSRRKPYQPRTIPCTVQRCNRIFSNQTGLKIHLNWHSTQHIQSDSSSEDDCHERDIMVSDSESEEYPSAKNYHPDFGDLHLSFDEPCNNRSIPNHNGKPKVKCRFHQKLNGRRCDHDGNFLPEGALPPPSVTPTPAGNDWKPWRNGLEFRTANLLYRKVQASAPHINEMMEIIAAMGSEEVPPLFADHRDLYATIDACEDGSVLWQAFSVKYDGPREPGKTALWMDQKYMVYFHDPRAVLHRQLGNPDFAGELETTPYEAESHDGKRQYQNFMSGNWAMREADTIIQDHPDTEGAMLCAAITGSDKTTVSVATGGVSLFMFLAIPKTNREHQDSVEFWRFQRHVFHQSLTHAFESLRPFMTKPDIVKLADGYYRRVIYSLGPYIGDYPEQVLLTCIVQGWCPQCTAHYKDLDGPAGPHSHAHTERVTKAMPSATQQWDKYGIVAGIMPFTALFPRADIHACIAPDILHQLIKGTFKDHLVTWVQELIKIEHDKKEAARIMADIDCRIAAAPLFPSLRRFPEGRGFKQWTGNDSKALMKVYLPAIAGRLPDGVVRAIAAFIDVCYLIRQDVISEDDIRQISAGIETFHRERAIFKDMEIKDTFSLPCQHSLSHYPVLIAEFGSPNGLCSSITESKHISAVKEPWRRSSRNTPLSEMLVINERMDKVEWAEVDFRHRGMLSEAVTAGVSEAFAARANQYAEKIASNLCVFASNPIDDEDDDGGPVDGRSIIAKVRLAKKHILNLPCDPFLLEHHLRVKGFAHYVRCFLYEQGLPPDACRSINWHEINENHLLDSQTKVWVYPSAIATFSAPSDLCGFGEMKHIGRLTTHLLAFYGIYGISGISKC
uniref:C2H2-type domain-containing protein n=1 Tax=Moniliophthora roreri TaxID=221103 RepID=A0A0W0FJN9_MONRR